MFYWHRAKGSVYFALCLYIAISAGGEVSINSCCQLMLAGLTKDMPDSRSGGSTLQAEVMLIVWIVVLSTVLLVMIWSVMAVLMFLFYSWLQTLLECWDVSSCCCCCWPAAAHPQEHGGRTTWCWQCETSQCGTGFGDSQFTSYTVTGMLNCRSKYQAQSRLYLTKAELISSLQNPILPRKIRYVILQAGVYFIALTFVPLVLHTKLLNAFRAAGNGSSNTSAYGGLCCNRTSPYEIETTPLLMAQPSPEWSREILLPVIQLKDSQRKSLYPQVLSTVVKFLFHIDEGAPEFAQFVRSTNAFVRYEFLVLCYEFFSVAFANVIPMISHSAKQLKRYNRAIETIQVQLQGGPNHGYCAMLNIGALERVQQVL